MISIDQITQAWEDLHNERGDPSQTARYRIGGTSKFGAYLAINFDDESPMLEFGPITPDLVKDTPLPSIKGVEAGLSLQLNELYLSLSLKQPGSIDIFLTLAARLAEELSGVMHPVSGYSAIRKVLVVWREFFSSERKVLSVSEQIGLAGELTLILLLIDHGIDETSVIRAWKGSEKSHHDFQLPKAALEVKSTVAHNIESVSISSLRQLESTGTKQLFLVQVAMDDHDHGDGTLPSLAKNIRDRLVSFPAESLEFEEKLLAAGYRDKDQSHYLKRSFLVRKLRAFRIDEGFPRLIHETVPNGVVEATYQVNLAAVATPPQSFDELIQTLSSKK